MAEMQITGRRRRDAAAILHFNDFGWRNHRKSLTDMRRRKKPLVINRVINFFRARILPLGTFYAKIWLMNARFLSLARWVFLTLAVLAISASKIPAQTNQPIYTDSLVERMAKL